MEPGPRQDRISDLYHRALACTPDERSAFLQAACDGDEALRQDVESLLGYESNSSRFLETPAALVANDFAGTPDRSQMVGRQLGPYAIISPLGAGGMGEVYRARDSKLGRDVAIKILPSQFTADPERRARFAREARLLATLNHPHIGAIYGLEETDGVTALVLELVEGPTLADRLARGPVLISEALAIARQIAEALDAAHEKGIVHRDLKPANIVLQSATNAAGVPSRELRARVLDFGLAKTMAVGLDGDVTQRPSGSLDGTEEGRILGTPAYMSPEQARGQAIDKRTDVWAFGCVLFEMLSGRRVFDGATTSDTFVSILERVPDWAALPSNTSVSIRTLLDRCLQKDPRNRLHDIADARIELDDRASTLASSAETVNASALVVARHRRREQLAWLVAAALGAALAAVPFFHVRAAPPAADPIEFAIAPPDNSRGVPMPAFSPDGRLLAVVAGSDGPRLWVRSLDTLAWRALPGTERARSPFWSPDSQSLGFFTATQLKMVQLSGAAPVIICEAPSGYTSPQTGTWNQGNVIVFAQSDGVPLQQVGAKGGVPTPVTALAPGDVIHHWPWFLPDGQHFLYLASGARDELRIGSLTSADTVSIGSFESQVVYAAGHLFFVRGGNLMAQSFDADTRQMQGDPVLVATQIDVDALHLRGAFSVSEAGRLAYGTSSTVSKLTWLDRQGKSLGTVGEPGVYANLNLSPDERRVAVSQLTQQPGSKAQHDIWLIDLGRAGTATRLTDDPGWEWDPAWSFDGTQVVFNSNRPDPYGSAYSLFVRPSNGSGHDDLLVKSDATASAPDWSPDGRFVVYQTIGAGTRQDLWALPVTGERTPMVFLATPHNEASGVFSPDGRWIAYESDVSGRKEVFVRPFPVRDGLFPISRNGGWSPRWRGDGKELFFVALDGTMRVVGIDSSKGFAATVSQPLFSTDLNQADFHPYAVTRDGQQFLMPLRGPDVPITVVLNWPEALRK